MSDGTSPGFTYALQRNLLAATPRIQITQERFEQLRHAREVLKEALTLEDVYAILIANYGEFERELVSTSVSEMIGFPYEYDWFYRARMELNRRLVNVLTSAKLYTFHITRRIDAAASIGDGQKVLADIRACLRTMHSERFEYRFMEALRNRAQHFGVPAESLSLGGPKDHDGQNPLCVEVYASKSEIARDGDFNKSVLNEMPEKVDLKHALRVYLSCLSVAHGKVRARLSTSVNGARALITEAIESYPKDEEGKRVGLQARRFDGEKLVEQVPILLEWDDTRLKLVRTNTMLSRLETQYISSRINPLR